MKRGHRIVLVNFLQQDVDRLERAGFYAELGYIGRQINSENTPCSFQRPLYEYDIYVFNGSIASQVQEMYRSPSSTSELRYNQDPLKSFATAPVVRIAFLGQNTPGSLFVAGIPFMATSKADARLSDIVTVDNDNAFRSAQLESCVGGLKNNIAFPIQRYVSYASPPEYPFSHFALMANRNGDHIATYGTVYDGEVLPAYIVLPPFNDTTHALIQVLDTLADICPRLFPDRPGKKSWLLTRDFAFSEEIFIDEEIAGKKAELANFLELKETEKKSVASEYEFMRRVLTAREDSTLEISERLSTNIKLSLEYLGFGVSDIDAMTRGAIKKEDYWATDEDYTAIVEVTATKNKNPKTKEFNDILGRMTTIFKRRDLVPDSSRITGLLILNYDLETHPFKRPRVYTGDSEEIVKAAEEQSIGLLSTVELYKILIAVKEGQLSRENARALLKKAGRIEYSPGSEPVLRPGTETLVVDKRIE